MSKKKIAVTIPEELEPMFKPGNVMHIDNPPSLTTRLNNVIDALEDVIQRMEKRQVNTMWTYFFVYGAGFAFGCLACWLRY